MYRASTVCLLAALVVSIATSAAAAATVDIVGDTEAVRYVAAPGERNDLTFSEIEDSWPSAFLVTDPGATIEARTGCISVDAHNAACVARSGSMYHLRAELGDGDDMLRPAGFNIVRANGGPGNDVLLGGTWTDRLDGGGGIDELRGGPEDDVLLDGDRDQGMAADAPNADILDGGAGHDFVSYEQRTEPVTLDLSDSRPDGAAGEQDVLLGLEDLHGGRGDDRLVGDDRANVFDDEGGTNTMIGGAGGDFFIAARAGSVDCGTGDDAIRGVTAKATLQRGCETLLRAGSDADFRAKVYPRRTADGFALGMECDTDDGEPIVCSGKAWIRAGSRTLARGVIRPGVHRRTARLALTPAGRRLLSRRTVSATVELRGEGIPHLSWGIVLRRHG
jgi:Ca2+-binding RTX toxin-like protein